ncbi:hypothetical protein BJ138DRAFT_1101340 [Hygrophoropsis aurantiaca]|uniref:Uncharacterized protein n=1 Tax=Hygrophoropsis aurantiaca TaxID=72124 RepID=A0ACB8AC75_9AGAM|nr:hypothetical protein BJ138DRAFT_1101340 [Hygrophoropsis aurantiaca]
MFGFNLAFVAALSLAIAADAKCSVPNFPWGGWRLDLYGSPNCSSKGGHKSFGGSDSVNGLEARTAGVQPNCNEIPKNMVVKSLTWTADPQSRFNGYGVIFYDKPGCHAKNSIGCTAEDWSKNTVSRRGQKMRYFSITGGINCNDYYKS